MPRTPEPFTDLDTDWLDKLDKQIFNLRTIDGRIIGSVALSTGWSVSRTKENISLVAPDGAKLALPTHIGLNAKVYRSKLFTVVRHADLEGRPLLGLVEYLIETQKIDPDRLRVLREAVDELEARRQAARAAKSVPEDSGNPSEPTSSHVTPKRHAHIVRREPWTAHGSPRHRDGVSQTYPSEAVMERTWSDKAVDFECRWEDCQYTNDNPRSVASHYAQHTAGQGRSPQPEVDGIDPDHRVNHRKQTRINKLRREINGALSSEEALDSDDPEFPAWLAAWIINHRVETVASSDDDTVVEELDNEQILDKIAALVDRGRGKVLREQIEILSGQMDDQLLQIDEIKTAAAAAEERARQAEARADNADSNLQAFRDLVNETITKNNKGDTP